MAGDLPTVSELTGCTCLQLRMLTRRVTQLYDAALEPAGLTCTQFSLLGHLVMQPNLSMGELARRLLMDPTTLTRVLQPLESKALVKAVVSADDRRRRSVATTTAGKAAFRRAVPLWRAARADLGSLLSGPDSEALDATLAASLETLGRA